jgi:hypothetical protein
LQQTRRRRFVGFQTLRCQLKTTAIFIIEAACVQNAAAEAFTSNCVSEQRTVVKVFGTWGAILPLPSRFAVNSRIFSGIVGTGQN